MVIARNIHKSFKGLHVLKGIDLTIKKGEVVVIIGPSGSGKSTFIRTLNHLETFEDGEITINGIQLQGEANLNLIRKDVGMVFQNFNLFPHLTVLQNITLAPIKVKGLSSSEAEVIANELLKRVGIIEKAHCYPSALSGGQQQRVAIARALAMSPKVMLFDEPTTGLDPISTNAVNQLIKDLSKKLKTT